MAEKKTPRRFNTIKTLTEELVLNNLGFYFIFTVVCIILIAAFGPGIIRSLNKTDDHNDEKIILVNQKPEAMISVSETGPYWENVTVLLKGNGSYDPDGEIVSHVWFIEGFDPIVETNTTIQLPMNGPNDLNIQLIVTDDNGEIDIEEMDIYYGSIPKITFIKTEVPNTVEIESVEVYHPRWHDDYLTRIDPFMVQFAYMEKNTTTLMGKQGIGLFWEDVNNDGMLSQNDRINTTKILTSFSIDGLHHNDLLCFYVISYFGPFSISGHDIYGQFELVFDNKPQN